MHSNYIKSSFYNYYINAYILSSHRDPFNGMLEINNTICE
jgi:hypothetical protein